MKRLAALVLALLLLGVAPAHAFSLLNVTVTTAVSAQVSAVKQVQMQSGLPAPRATIQFKFVYGSGGTSVDAWVQTSIDGSTWTDIANFHFTTATATRIVNLSASTAVTTAATPTDGTLTANTVVDGILGSQFRVKYTTVGTYAGGTTMAVDVTTSRLAP